MIGETEGYRAGEEMGETVNGRDGTETTEPGMERRDVRYSWKLPNGLPDATSGVRVLVAV
ncbi:hypothetical protein [Rathayibacter sp. VKM Ac-2927]|uniref:hypothetical protein n=1 Tax=Rathayibacter sp. VKM Ac-2927 TaxID=2929478 RepID=UPI001FB56C0A|nr:hypothetical protein [Rathayibacter sp. VKM Ac-2927]MCJ1688568.1 hypothetical protein [Rathayibacter sp. VKM Ac-2927]